MSVLSIVKAKGFQRRSWESELREVKILSILYLTSNLTLSDDYTDLRLDLNFDNLLNFKRNSASDVHQPIDKYVDL